jgi:pyruvate/2-oxoacid:ferredoxin oxidoreductase beta subunit/intein/homing endonuclease
MNIKELAERIEKKNVMVSGHRTCSGCPIGIISRTVASASDDPVVVSSATSCAEVTTTIYPQTSWNMPWIHSAFANSAATISGVEKAYLALKKKGKIKKDINFLVIAGDGGSFDIGLSALSGALERGHNFVYLCYTNEGYMNCLSKDSLIYTENGLKKVSEIIVGEKVYAFDQKTHKLVLKNCSGVFNNGVKKVYEIETFHHNIKATGNHPFLIVDKKPRGKPNTLFWKTLTELKKGDQVITLKKLEGKKAFTFEKIKLVKKGDYKVNCINNVKIPIKSTKDLMLFLGLYIGDGWSRTEKGEIGFALPEGTVGRDKCIKACEKIFKLKQIKTDKIYIYLYSVNIAKFIESLGFKHGAKNKIIPSWVYTIPDDQKEAFIEGLLLSDGYIYKKKKKDSCRYLSASKELILRLRLLLQTLDYRVGKITIQKREKGTFVVYRPLLKDSKYYSICFSKKYPWNIEKYPTQYKYQNFLIGNKNFDTEIIKNIKEIGKEKTFDLRVEGEHNFIADGIVVHNTGNQRSSATPKGASTSTTPSGVNSYGKIEYNKDLTQIAIAHNIPYVAQVNPYNQIDMYNKAKKAFEKKGPAVLIAYAACPTNMKADPSQTIAISKLATESNFWPLYEYEDGKLTINYKPKNRISIEEFLKTQTKFKEVLKEKNKEVLRSIQEDIDNKWNSLLRQEELSK